MTVESNQCFISKKALALIKLCAKDKFRPVLVGMNIIDGKAYCADSFILGEAVVEQGKEFPNCILNSKDLLAAKVKPKKDGLIVSKMNDYYIIEGVLE